MLKVTLTVPSGKNASFNARTLAGASIEFFGYLRELSEDRLKAGITVQIEEIDEEAQAQDNSSTAVPLHSRVLSTKE